MSTDRTAQEILNAVYDANNGILKAEGSTYTGTKTVTGTTQETNFKKCLTIGTLSIYISDGTTADAALTGVEGDICLNGGTAAGQAAYCDANGTNWTDM